MLEIEGNDKDSREWGETPDVTPEEGEGDDDFHGIDIEEFFGDDDYSYRERLEKDRNEEQRSFDFSEGTTFTEALLEQLAMRDLDERQKGIASEIVGSIDASGYLGRNLQLIANDMAFRSGTEVSDEEMEQMLKVVQSLDPAGVGARSLQECLSLQLHRSETESPAHQLATAIVDKHFSQLSNKRYNAIMEMEGCDESLLHEAVDIIQHLNPKPGWGSGDESRGSHYIIPDFIVSREGGNISFALSERNNPQLHISGEYSDMMKQLASRKSLTASERETLQFIKSKSESAQWLIDSLQQRQQTLASTMTAILGMQRDYFLTGNPADLKPMRLKDIASITGYDESTISRVANQKYVQSDFGTFLLKELFSKAVATDNGDIKALQHVKETLRAIIDSEDKSQPLTDEALTQKMQEKGFTLSRRTVSKYRESLGIPVGRLRREL